MCADADRFSPLSTVAYVVVNAEHLLLVLLRGGHGGVRLLLRLS